MQPTHTPLDSQEPSRRETLRLFSQGLGLLALQGMALGKSAQGIAPPGIGKAKRVIYLCMSGAPSHVDTFDYKPELTRNTGKTLSGTRRGASLLGSPWKFKQRGDSGLWISELFPHVAKHADSLCLLRGMHTEIPAHTQAQILQHTGSSRFVRPSLGAWSLYGLGSQNPNLPGFVTINPQGRAGAQLYGSGFLPGAHQGLRIRTTKGSPSRRSRRRQPVEDLTNARLSRAQQRKQLDLVQELNQAYAKREGGSPDIDAVSQSYELAFRMQSELPSLLDLETESPATLNAYGIGQEATDDFGNQCLTALKLAQAGVRFIEVSMGGWDHHRNLREALPQTCRAVDQPIAALLEDLKRHSMLDETLVIWGGEFGRTPYAQNGDGRDHNNRGFTTWMAGGGVKGGYSHGATDENGIEAVEGRMSTHDWHATILHLLGINHERLTYNYAGRDFRLTDVYGQVAKDILA